MKITPYTLFLFLCLNCTPFLLDAQNSCTNNRYIDDNFSITEITGVEFATAPDVFEQNGYYQPVTTPQTLYLDVYLPAGDDLTKRPLIVMAFGGSFLFGDRGTNINSGNPPNPPLKFTCQAWARKGFVVASIDYRLGYNVSRADAFFQFVRAVHRGTQDLRAAIRFMKRNATTYNIDPNMVFVGGHSAGAVATMNSAYLTEAERAASNIMDATYQFNNFDGIWPDLNCLDCEGNPNDVSSSFQVGINLWGAVLDIDWIDAGETPLISFHGDADVVAGINSGILFDLQSPFGNVAYGSIPIHERLDQVGILNQLHVLENEPHEPWYNPTTLDYIVNNTAAFLVEYMQPATPSINGMMEVEEGTTATYTTPAVSGMTYCWEVINGTIISENGNQITVQWNSGATIGTVSVRLINEHEVESEVSTFNVNITATPPKRLYAKVFLEGAYTGGSTPMSNALRTTNSLPINQPYNIAPWGYGGTESVNDLADIPTNVVDWVLVELRSNNNPNMILEQATAFLLTDGTLQGVDGMEGVVFNTLVNTDNYYISIRHRNHLDVTTATAIALPNTVTTAYDFTAANSQVLGEQQMKVVGLGITALRAGDVDANGVINVRDFNRYVQEIGQSGYLASDCNLDRNNTIMDFNVYQSNASIIGVNVVRY